jgi:hypothetical protein
LACREKNCRDPCNCPPNTKCTVINHVPRCSCPAGYKGEPNTTKGCFLPGIVYFCLISELNPSNSGIINILQKSQLQLRVVALPTENVPANMPASTASASILARSSSRAD